MGRFLYNYVAVLLIITLKIVVVDCSKWCTYYYAVTSVYYRRCGSVVHGSDGPCTKYRYIQKSYEDCCAGYDYHPYCYPKCNGRTWKENACDEVYLSDVILYRGGGNRRSGEGTCESPNKCIDCKDGFYADGGRCLICPAISYCNHRKCTTVSDNYCEWCQYEIMDQRYYRGYTRHYDGAMKQCKKACSWRSDSTRCYPGDCAQEIVESCSCTSGFGGNQCDTITEESLILYAEIKLHNPSLETVTTPTDPSETGPQPIRFTNKDDLNEAEIEFHAKFVASGIPPTLDPDHFVKYFTYGIVYGEMEIKIVNGSTITSHRFSCPATEDYPITLNYVCSRKHSNNSAVSLPKFNHYDTLMFTITVRNGGYLTYLNREHPSLSPIRSSLKGITTTRAYTIQWDYVDPYFPCLYHHGRNCIESQIDMTDVTDQSKIVFTWKPWLDDLAGVDYYEYEVYQLADYGHVLKESHKLLHSNKTTTREGEFNVTEPGMYSIILTAFDKAGNFKSTRSLLFFDDQSVLEIIPGTRTIVTESTIDTNRTWVVSDTSQLTVMWSGRFINERHDVHKWLYPVGNNSHVDNVYDDYFERRTVDWFTNVKGVVKFDVNYTVFGPDIKSYQVYTNVMDILPESELINVVWEDGQKLEISVKATDIIGEYTEDSITVYRDTTEPIIENLWLSYGNKTELFVHRLEDFTEMTFEWDAFDYHSGLHSVHWKLYDNVTGNEVLHGNSHIVAQGNAENMSLCEDLYEAAPRGPDCYCTLYHGCFHRHFHVKPDIVLGAGLKPGKDKGLHESDYFIEISIINQAMSSSVLTRKITIDLSPPQSGTVHDGIFGRSEVDYQQEFTLHFHWQGFFDPESGVKYYKYIVAERCFKRGEMLTNVQARETTETAASHLASLESTFYITVVAMNRANDASTAVCSDGVTIVTATSSVKNVIIEGLRTAPRLVEDTDGNTWVVSEAVTRFLYNDTLNCNASTVLIEDIQLIPETDTSFVTCDQLQTSIPNLLQVLPQTSQMVVSWESTDDDKIVYDYEIGFSSTKQSPAPDILPFRSTKHHRHTRVDYPNLSEGTVFYLVIKSISKSEVVGYQSVGPIVMGVTPPTFHGSSVDVRFEDNTLIANWSKGAFQDSEDFHPLQFSFAIGHTRDHMDVSSYQPLTFNSKCQPTVPAECTAIRLASLESVLHAHHVYYVTIKATNLAGLSTTVTSEAYTHDVQIPSAGVAYDIDLTSVKSNTVKYIIDVDFTNNSDTLAVQWSGFHHPHLTVTYTVCVGTAKGVCDVDTKENIPASVHQIIFGNLSLSPLQKYFSTVEAITSTGAVKAFSDGLVLIDNKIPITGITINDGPLCNGLTSINRSHSSYNIIKDCQSDLNYQTSTTTLFAKWTIPGYLSDVIRSAWVSVDVRSPVGDFWSRYMDYGNVGSHDHAEIGSLDLQPGRTYRFNVKLCADVICFAPISSDGVTIIPSAPVAGKVEVMLEKSKMVVIIDEMYDPDIEDLTEAKEAIDVYNWAIIDGSLGQGIFENWGKVTNLQPTNNTHLQFEINLSHEIDFSKCKKLAVRGINKAGVWNELQTEIKKCHVTGDHKQIIPRTVIDVVNKQDDELVNDVSIDINEPWTLPDVDYTPSNTKLSAVWPSLRHGSFQWGVLEVRSNDALTFYRNYTDVIISDPCSHPDIIKCGHTVNRYVNVNFNKTEKLQHGRRYSLCVHSEKKEIKHEKWTEILDAVSTCSDGVVVDLTAPIPGNVWVGPSKESIYQTSLSDIFVTWDSFVDVEEEGYSMHSSGISHYLVSVGSVENAVDIVDKRNVGVTNHVSFHGLELQEGHRYYVSVSGVDFINRTTKVNANPITVDITPPEVSSQSIYVSGRILTNFTEIDICWHDIFVDVESGIDHYMIGLGSLSGQDDQIKFQWTDQDCDTLKPALNHQLVEGHPYFVSVKAFNRAGLSSSKSSLAIIYDVSPPVAGHVYDGAPETVTSHSKDTDYQTDMTRLSVYWEGFSDPHSVIKYYSVDIGTCSGCNDILRQHIVGVHTYFTYYSDALEGGRSYYSTVTACNTGNLCTSVTSDGVTMDNSPPVPGLVQDGSRDQDIEYTSTRNFVSAKWFGFADAQSDIDYFVVRVGNLPGSADIYSPRLISNTDVVLISDMTGQLPLGKRIYTTIRAYNKAGLHAETTSNGFLVDVSPPDVLEPPQLSRDIGSIKLDTSILRSVLRFKWKVEDKQSSIQRQYISIVSHHNGEFNSSSKLINGIHREFTMADLDLHDGCTYNMKLIVCNGAQICIETESDGVLVDTTPPISGMFAIGTYHAAELQRHTTGWMTWSDYRLNLSWVGFSDLHSGIDKYYVAVGSHYMGNDLNKVPTLPAEFSHNDSSVEYADEGPLQYFVVPTQHLVNYEHVFISVWATNMVGLSSDMIHYQFRLISGGFLDLIRRCDALSCEGHCVCSPKDQSCHVNVHGCYDISQGNQNTKIGVSDITDLSESTYSDVEFTPSNSNLAAKWNIIKQEGLFPQWYEWSVGLTSQDSPEGVIDTAVDPLWKQAGQKTEAVFSMKPREKLKELYTYSVFVRVWYNSDTFAVFKSNGITIHSRSIIVNDHLGAAVAEKLPNFWKNDVDFIKQGFLYTVYWKNVFVAPPGSIEKFNVYLSTYSQGEDFHSVNVNVNPDTTAFNISRLSMTPGLRYYSNVVATTYSGLQTTASSDGVMVDVNPPKCGLVYDGNGLHDMEFQNESDIAASRWHGFTDLESGIVSYEWCVGTSQIDDSCDITIWKKVGMHTSISIKLQTPLLDGVSLFNKVKAIDDVGHVSDIVSSNEVKIDTTPPIPVSFYHGDHYYVNNPSFEESNGCFMNISEIPTDICGYDNCYQPAMWSVTGCVVTIRSDVNAAFNGRSMIFVRGDVKQNVTGLNSNVIYKVSFVTAHIPIKEAIISNLEGKISFGKQEHAFLMYTKGNQSDIVWHRHVFYFKVNQNIAEIIFSSLQNHFGFLLDNIRVEAVETQPGDGGVIQVNSVELHRWSSIHASWLFVDTESSITEYLWAIGNTEGSGELQDFRSVGVNNFAYNYDLTLVHASKVYVTVVAINGAGLRSVAYSAAVDIDKTPPVLGEINDGTGVDIDGQTANTISANWKVSDVESGIDYCEWSVGFQRFGNELFPLTHTTDHSSASVVVNEADISQKTIYSTVRCYNRGGLFTEASSDGVTVSMTPPSSDKAEITILPVSLTEYSPGEYHQGDVSTVRMQWTGFSDQFGIMSFVIKLDGNEIHLKNTILDVNKGVSYMEMRGLDLGNNVYTASVAATNLMYIRSNMVYTNITVNQSSPSAKEGSSIRFTKTGDVVNIDWQDCFMHGSRLVYEVSIGTYLGGADVIQWQETVYNFIDVKITDKMKRKSDLKFYVYVRAITESGLFSSKSSDLSIK